MTTIGVFAMIFDGDNRLLCVRNNYGKKYWTTPGGRLEEGESPVVALQREVFEETGFRVEKGDFIGVYAKPWMDDIVLTFEARIIAREFWEPNDEIAEVCYFKQRDLPLAMSAVVRCRIDDAFARKRGVFRVLQPDV